MVNRRSFIKYSSALAAGMTVSSLVGRASAAKVSANDTI
ncbi:MAG: twin-arginine translocation signal domain-containing protein, partial [Prevotellaceae bacterium]|nr:twin-arginine translocation signal domain-containing protein [Prevotellaceae bacterium]